MTETETASLLDRTLRTLRESWRGIADSARGAIVGSAIRPDLPPDDLARLKAQMQACLEARGGEVSARARAAELGETYLALSREGRRRFLNLLAEDFECDHERVGEAAQALAEARRDGADTVIEREQALRQVLEPPRVKLLTQFNGLPAGIKFLVDLRSDLLDGRAADPALARVEGDLKGLLAGWFDVGFLDLRRITWDAPASLLEKLSVYEAVHEVRSWDDLKNRLDSDRRCFAFFHPRMPNEPLIFVEVALVSGLADDVQRLLDEGAPVGNPAAADTAIFYSISNAQKGLAGISFGGFLIKRVVDLLSAEFPKLRTFATLSPIPGFRAWFDRRMAEGEPQFLTAAERKALAAALGAGSKGALKTVLADDAWSADPKLRAALKAPLMRLVARYLVEEKRQDGRARDPVAHFHLSNGARVERLNWLADTSAKGLRQSMGVMVNYQYRQSDIEANHEAYVGEGRVTAASAVSSLL